MSGTKAYKERKTVEHQSRIEQIIALNDNRTALLNAIADYMHAKYGDGCFYNDHPAGVGCFAKCERQHYRPAETRQ